MLTSRHRGKGGALIKGCGKGWGWGDSSREDSCASSRVENNPDLLGGEQLLRRHDPWQTAGKADFLLKYITFSFYQSFNTYFV